MKYTIIDTGFCNGAKIIQQDFEKIEDAKAKLKILQAKVSDRHTPVIVGVDANGDFHSLDKIAEKNKTPAVKP